MVASPRGRRAAPPATTPEAVRSRTVTWKPAKHVAEIYGMGSSSADDAGSRARVSGLTPAERARVLTATTPMAPRVSASGSAPPAVHEPRLVAGEQHQRSAPRESAAAPHEPRMGTGRPQGADRAEQTSSAMSSFDIEAEIEVVQVERAERRHREALEALGSPPPRARSGTPVGELLRAAREQRQQQAEGAERENPQP